MRIETFNKGVVHRGIANLKLHDLARIVGGNKKYCVMFTFSEMAHLNATGVESSSDITDSVMLMNSKNHQQVRVFRTIEQAFKFLEDANLLEKFTVEICRGVIIENGDTLSPTSAE